MQTGKSAHFGTHFGNVLSPDFWVEVGAKIVGTGEKPLNLDSAVTTIQCLARVTYYMHMHCAIDGNSLEFIAAIGLKYQMKCSSFSIPQTKEADFFISDMEECPPSTALFLGMWGGGGGGGRQGGGKGSKTC